MMEDQTVNCSDLKSRKRKIFADAEELATTPPKHPLLESVAHRFQQNRREQQDRLDAVKTRRETEKVHSRFLRDNSDCSPIQLLQAECAANHWAKKHGVKDDPFASRTRASPARRAGLFNNRVQPSSSLNNQSATSSRMASKTSQSRATITANSQSASTTASSTYSQSTTSARNRRNSSNSSNVSSGVRANDNESTVFEADSVDQGSGNTVTVIDLETSANDSLILLPDGPFHSPRFDRSNNAGSTTTLGEKTRCRVLNCEASFSTEGALGQHMNLFKHSTCNPCLKAKDCKLSPDPLFYMCPDCDREFQTSDECHAHMKTERHSPFYPPLAIAGYMCAQCLYVFENFAACWNHIEDSAHKDICYPFADDLASHSTGVGPVAVIQELVDDIVRNCRDIACRVQCLECSLYLESPGALRNHMLETNDRHLVSVLCDTSLVDVFAGYIAGYSCDKCRRLFNGDLKDGAKHDCAKGVIGTIMENDVSSFFDFVKRCALTLIKSLDIKDSRQDSRPRPGPSNYNKERTEGATAAAARYSSPKRSQVEVISSDDNDDDNNDDEEDDDDKNEASLILISDADSGENTTETSLGAIRRKKKKNRKSRKKKKSSPGVNTGGTAAGAVNTAPQANIPDVWAQLNGLAQTITTNQNTSQATAGNGNSAGHQQSSGSAAGNQSFLPPQGYAPQFLPPHFRYRPPLPLPAGMGLPCSSQSVGAMPLLTQPPPLLPTPLAHMPTPLALLPTPVIPLASRMLPYQQPGASYPQRASRYTYEPSTRHQGPRPGSSRDRSRTKSPVDRQSDPTPTSRDRSRSPLDTSLISTESLSKMRNIIFLDLDNWCSFFSKLPRALPEQTFVWAFYGGTRIWYEPNRCFIFNKMKTNGQFYLNERCGNTKDAADFAIVLSVGKMDERLPTDVAFTILSGDRGFMEVERQMKSSSRKAVVINPHHAEKFSNEMIYTMVTSVTDT